MSKQRAEPCSIHRCSCWTLHSENLKGWMPSSPLRLDLMIQPCQSTQLHCSPPPRPNINGESSWPNPRLCPMAWARLLARMWGSNGLTSTFIPTDLSVQILPTLAVVVSPLLKEFRPLEISQIICQAKLPTQWSPLSFQQVLILGKTTFAPLLRWRTSHFS